MVEHYHAPREGSDGTAAAYKKRWGDPRTSPEELRRRFEEDFSGASDDPMVTGGVCSWPPEVPTRRVLSHGRPRTGHLRENLQGRAQVLLPWNIHCVLRMLPPQNDWICCAGQAGRPTGAAQHHPVFLPLLPSFVVDDFGCGALRSAIGKLPFLVAQVVLVSDLFHVVNHLCSHAFHPRSYSDLDGSNTMAHEQRNAPINLMCRSLRACGQDEYMYVLQLENILYDIMAHVLSTSPHRLPEYYKFRQKYFSRNPPFCGCGHYPTAPEMAPPPPDAEPPADADPESSDDE